MNLSKFWNIVEGRGAQGEAVYRVAKSETGLVLSNNKNKHCFKA